MGLACASASGRNKVTSENWELAPQSIVTVLLISPFDEDHRDLEEILRHSNWRLRSACTQMEAYQFLEDDRSPVVICESDLPDGTWKDVLSKVSTLDCPPILVVASRLADESLWSEVLHLGAYNVLAKPLHATEVLHVVGSAWLFWKNQLERSQPRVRTASGLRPA
jgi:DNA-binding NtrC family response regulator